MEKKQKIGFVAQVKAVLRDKNGKVKGVFDSAKQKLKDCMTNMGFAALSALILTDVAKDAFDYIAIGTGTIAAAATDTALQTEVKRKAGTGTRITKTVSNDTAQLVATFSSGDGLSGTNAITEYGMLNAAAGGDLLLHEVDATAKNCNWGAGDTLEVTVTVQCKQGA